MKKIFAVFLAIFAMAYFSMPAFAAVQCKNSSIGDGSIELSKDNDATVGLSQNVEARYCSDTGSYSAITHNPKGMGKLYGVASDSNAITYKNDTSLPTTTYGNSQDVTGGNPSSGTNWSPLGG